MVIKLSSNVILNQNLFMMTSLSYTLALGLQRLYLKLGYILSIKKMFSSQNKVSKSSQDTYHLYGTSYKKLIDSSL